MLVQAPKLGPRERGEKILPIIVGCREVGASSRTSTTGCQSGEAAASQACACFAAKSPMIGSLKASP